MRMSRGHVVLALLSSLSILLASVASAQPGSSPPPPPPVYSPPPPPPPGYGYPQQPVGLTVDEQRLLARGEISPGAHIGGGALSLFFGFGVGQAVQGRWTDTGWIFTVGEAASIAALFIGFANEVEDCGFEENCNNGGNDLLIIGGLLGILGFRVWEIADAFVGPSNHNRRLRQLHMRLGYPPPGYYSAAPFVAPTRQGDGGVAGITIRF